MICVLLSFSGLKYRGTMEQPGPSTDPQKMEGLEVKPFMDESVDQLGNGSDEKDTISLHGIENSLNSKEEINRESTTNNKQGAQRCSQETLDGEEPVSNKSDSSTVFSGSERPSPVSSDGVPVTLVAPAAHQDVVEGAPPAETTEIPSTNQTADPSDGKQPSLLVSRSSESSPVDSGDLSESPSSCSVQSSSKNSFTDSSTTSGIFNGPSTPSSDTVSSSPASSPQTRSNDLHSSSSPFDTDCSRKLISQIQRTLSQESLLDELESELLNCQLAEGVGEGKRKGSPPVNGLSADQKGCMMAFEKCVQDKYTKQEKAIQR